MELKSSMLIDMPNAERAAALEKGSAALKLHLDKMLRKKIITEQYHKDKVETLKRQMLDFKSGE